MSVHVSRLDTHGEDSETDGDREKCLGRSVTKEPWQIDRTVVQ